MWDTVKENLLSSKMNTRELIETLESLHYDSLSEEATVVLEKLFGKSKDEIEIFIFDTEDNSNNDENIETCLSLGKRGFNHSYSFDRYHIISQTELTEDEQEEIMALRYDSSKFTLSTGKLITI